MSDVFICDSCGSDEFKIKTNEVHGYGIWCNKCNKFIKWTGKGRERKKKNNPNYRKLHKKDGELVCELCGISESEAKEMGFHFAEDHIIAEEFGGDDTFENSRPLCSICHYEKTARENRTRGIKKLLEKINTPKEKSIDLKHTLNENNFDDILF